MLFNEKTYAVLKQIALLWLPAFASLYLGVAALWELPAGEAVSGTVMLVDTFLGVILGISTKAYNSSDAKFDGELKLVDSGEGTSNVILKSVDHNALLTKDELLFKVHQE